MNPIVVHVVRPYASEQEYLTAEAWSIDLRTMLLIDAAPLPAETPILFDVALADGHKPIRAEGRVMAAAPARDGRPAGLKVRFKRFGAATKAFIERAVKTKSAAEEPERPSSPEAQGPNAPEAEPASVSETERVSMPEVRASMTELEAFTPTSAPVASPPPFEAGALSMGDSARRRSPGTVTAPVNRDELLARLRHRRQAG